MVLREKTAYMQGVLDWQRELEGQSFVDRIPPLTYLVHSETRIKELVDPKKSRQSLDGLFIERGITEKRDRDLIFDALRNVSVACLPNGMIHEPTVEEIVATPDIVLEAILTRVGSFYRPSVSIQIIRKLFEGYAA